METKFSIIMTCNRRWDKIMSQAIDSLKSQTYTNFELIFVSAVDGTSVAIGEHLKGFNMEYVPVRVGDHLTRHQKFSYGTEYAEGDYVICFDSDDVLHPQALEIVDISLKMNPSLKFFTSSHIAFKSGEQHGFIHVSDPNLQTVQNLILGFRQRHLWGFPVDTTYWPKGFLESTDPVEDYWAFACLAMAGVPVMPIPHCLYGWRVWPGQYTQRKMPEMIQMCDRIVGVLSKFKKKEGPMWHFGDMALAARMGLVRERLMNEVLFR